MISSKTQQFISDFDFIIDEKDNDFELSGLKKSSVIRISRLAVVENSLLIGRIGSVSEIRLSKIYERIIFSQKLLMLYKCILTVRIASLFAFRKYSK